MSEETPVDLPMIEWNGRQYNPDPTYLTMGEYEAISQRCDVIGLVDMIRRAARVDHIAWKAIFWAQDRRHDPDLKWSDYEGPTMRVVLKASQAWPQEETAQLLGDGEPGKDSSPTGSDG